MEPACTRGFAGRDLETLLVLPGLGQNIQFFFLARGWWICVYLEPKSLEACVQECMMIFGGHRGRIKEKREVNGKIRADTGSWPAPGEISVFRLCWQAKWRHMASPGEGAAAFLPLWIQLPNASECANPLRQTRKLHRFLEDTKWAIWNLAQTQAVCIK